MDRTILVIAGLALAASLVANTQEQDDDRFTGEREAVSAARSPAGTEASTSGRAAEGIAHKPTQELLGMKVVTLTGDEVGEIADVGMSPAHDERIATIVVDGFAGAGEKTIGIPLSELQPSVTDPGSVRTSLTRPAIELHSEVEDSGFASDD